MNAMEHIINFNPSWNSKYVQVREDIFKTLNMNKPLIFSTPVFRANLYYDVWFNDIIDDPYDHLKQFIKQSLGPNDDSIPKVIIYR